MMNTILQRVFILHTILDLTKFTSHNNFISDFYPSHYKNNVFSRFLTRS